MLHNILTFKANIKLILMTTLLSNLGIFMVVPFLAIYLSKLHSLNTLEIDTIISVAFRCQRAALS
ncbi:putative membrane protein [Bartonella silvatica]|uniref:Membrane protein n=1 Tax=Bartonella silvatica TaxID=357760 RepID=A0ABV2HIS2_9HYPH